LSEYRVAMDAPSRAENRGGETTRFPTTRVRPYVRETRSSRVRQTLVQRKELSRTKLVATCPMSIARLKLDGTHGWVSIVHKNSHLVRRVRIKRLCRLVLAGLRH